MYVYVHEHVFVLCSPSMCRHAHIYEHAVKHVNLKSFDLRLRSTWAERILIIISWNGRDAILVISFYTIDSSIIKWIYNYRLRGIYLHTKCTVFIRMSHWSAAEGAIDPITY